MNPELLASFNGQPLDAVEARVRALRGIVRVVTLDGRPAMMTDIACFGPNVYVDLVGGLVQNAREDA